VQSRVESVLLMSVRLFRDVPQSRLGKYLVSHNKIPSLSMKILLCLKISVKITLKKVFEFKMVNFKKRLPGC